MEARGGIDTVTGERCRNVGSDFTSVVTLPVLTFETAMLQKMAKVAFTISFYLDRYFIARRSLPPLNDVGLLCFRKLVYGEINVRAREAVISLINQEREGEQIDRALLKNVLAIFVDIGANLECYVNDFEAELAEECLKREKDRVTHYLHSSTEEKLIEQVQEQLLSKISQQLLEKEYSGSYALKRGQGLDPVSLMFKQHVTSEGIAVVNQAEDAANSRKLHLVPKHVDNGFVDSSRLLTGNTRIEMYRARKSSSSAELLSNFSDNILKKGGSEKLDDDVIEDTLDKVVKVLAYISDKDLFVEFYRKKLARRLLFGTSANDDHERSILSKLKQ
ncbi:hypothetical protein C5167_019160 [Papaver somniferum]|uniref:Cullin family profile domain-containing protein n=1 Tax=Papaver somniferum TaxID=3469 RepID=A0A4Y7ITA9_PAPSO|nr:hypothetical protein C5167_019160 [Papaver somniferum]